MEKIQFPALTSIPSSNAFCNGSALKVIDFGQPISFGFQCFLNCNALKTIVLRGDTLTTMEFGALDNTPFGSGGTGGIALVPRSLIESYQNATNWSALYAAGTCLFWALEDYTVDGTTTGALDPNKVAGN